MGRKVWSQERPQECRMKRAPSTADSAREGCVVRWTNYGRSVLLLIKVPDGHRVSTFRQLFLVRVDLQQFQFEADIII